jgi:hypothetical protein
MLMTLLKIQFHQHRCHIGLDMMVGSFEFNQLNSAAGTGRLVRNQAKMNGPKYREILE